MPPFAWSPVAAADHYEFQIAADAGFNSPVLGSGSDDFTTQNTRATVLKTIPNGTYYWRVRAIAAGGSVSAWTAGRSFRKAWTGAAALQSPAGGANLSFGTDPLKLGWSAVPGASNYLVSLASDPSLGSLAFHLVGDPTGIPKVQANSLAVSIALATGTYYWNVIPLDAEGNRGTPSAVASFSWSWPSTTTPSVTDLDPNPEVFDSKFSWNPVAGAARYELEINSSSDFALGSKVCCSGTTIATSLSPTAPMKDNVYYWRVRAFDPDGNAGVWNYGPNFTKTFDKTAPAGPVTGTAIKNLHMRDNVTDNTETADADHNLLNGYQTTAPVVSWDPVPGAASYEVQISDWNSGTQTCAPVVKTVKTSVPAWTPLGNPSANPAGSLFPNPASDLPALLPGKSYCVRVSARADRVGSDEVFGDPTYLKNGNTDDGSPNPQKPAFEWTGYPSGGLPGCVAGVLYPCSTDYLAPQTDTVSPGTPLFTWNALNGAQSYFVVVSKDQNFSNIVDEGFTNIPAYAPRSGTVKPTTYPDETTSYYWMVLPSPNLNGFNPSPIDRDNSNYDNFQKQSAPPTLQSPAPGTAFFDQPAFRWSPVLGARKYQFQVAQDPSFGSPIDDITTDATAYSSNTTYPADTILYWRVRASDENGIGLTWSATGTFQKRLAAPVPSSTNPTSGEYLPVWIWNSVNGAVSYDLSIDQPDGQTKTFTDFRMPATSFQKLTGTGVFHWRVRAEFPKQGSGETPGPWSASMPFTRTIGEPGGLKTDSAPDHVLLSWNPKLGVKQYKLQVSGRPDFSTTIENVTTDNTAYAPKLSNVAYLSGNQLYWRVAGVDPDGNLGDYSPAQPLSMLPRMKMTAKGSLRKKLRRTVTITVKNAGGNWIKGAKVRVTGAGVKARTRSTSVFGVVRFTIRPTKRGRVLFTAKKPGFQSAGITLRVR
ncbi:MAG TPA: hypothetical protein VEL10_02055 [Gaiellaceae bacterium]|nr:hypothetical protein [Gaiellaceae bacterium]